jgi:formylglycine-generating enzyme required for sulfatase activity
VYHLPPALFEWIEIPAGRVTLVTEKGWAANYIPEGQSRTFEVPAFAIAKYPVTNVQYALFIEAGGYREKRWWTAAGWSQREKEQWTQPRYWEDETWNGAEQPVVGVSWYEALAFCQWLSHTSGEKIMLPTEQQWQRAAQGDDGRAYPWGNDWDCANCNNSVSPCNSNRTSPVQQYERRGDSPFGVVDMAGNVWEWCLTEYMTGKTEINSDNMRVLRGGSWGNLSHNNFRVGYRSRGSPRSGDYSRGFRFSRSF